MELMADCVATTPSKPFVVVNGISPLILLMPLVVPVDLAIRTANSTVKRLHFSDLFAFKKMSIRQNDLNVAVLCCLFTVTQFKENSAQNDCDSQFYV